jgi:hypothetical protein
MKISSVKANNKKKCFEILAGKQAYSLPYSRLELKPSARNPIEEVFVDKELGGRAITYKLASGDEASVHLDAFLDYNSDPSYLRELIVHQLTVEVNKRHKHLDISKHEIVRRLKTSPSQLYRLLDPANSKKSVDEMLRLLAVLGCEVKMAVKLSHGPRRVA